MVDVLLRSWDAAVRGGRVHAAPEESRGEADAVATPIADPVAPPVAGGDVPEGAIPLDGGAGACHDPGRAMLFNRVARYFYSDSELVDFDAPVKCGQCRRLIRRGFTDGRPLCAAQRAITSGRPMVGDGVKPRYHGTFNAEKKAVLITADAAIAIVSIRPMQPLPPDLTVFEIGNNAARRELYRKAFEAPLSAPSLFVEFTKSGGLPLIPSERADVVVACRGGRPVEIDVARVREVSDGLRAIGQDGLVRLSNLRRDRARGKPLGADEQHETMDLARRLARAGCNPAFLPASEEPAYDIARCLVGYGGVGDDEAPGGP